MAVAYLGDLARAMAGPATEQDRRPRPLGGARAIERLHAREPSPPGSTIGRVRARRAGDLDARAALGLPERARGALGDVGESEEPDRPPPRSRGSVGAEFVVQHDGAAGGVVRDVRAHCLTLGGFTRRTQGRRIVEVGLEHAVVR